MNRYKLKIGDLVVRKGYESIMGTGIVINTIPLGHSAKKYKVLFGDCESICYFGDLRKVL